MKLFQKYIIPYLKQFKWLLIATIFLGILTVVAASMLTFTSGYLITRASEMPATILLLYIPIVGVRTFGISRAVTRYLERLTGHNTVLKILADMRVKLYSILEPQALFIRSRFQTGDLLGTLADDIEHLQDAYIRTIFPTIIGLFLFTYSVIVLALFDWLFALFMTFCLSIIVFVYPLISLYFLKKHQLKLKDIRSGLYQSFTDAIFGLTDWMISGRKETFINGFTKESRKSGILEKKLENWNQSRTFQLQIISGIILILVGLWAGAAAQSGDIAPTYIAAFTLVSLPILEGLIPLSHAIERLPSYQESLKRIDNLQQFVSEKGEVTEQLNMNEYPDIILKNVTYQYQGQVAPALENISLSVQNGQKVAILGKSGAGKSTLLQLLLGALTPDSGNIQIGGYAPEMYGDDNITNILSVLNQKPYLFATSVKNNIRLGNQKATNEDINNVISDVKLEKYIQSLPIGIETQMEETGQRFSGGERQRIALARILLKNSPIVVLDEPTVGLDPLTEADLLNTIFAGLQNKTIIMITHHLIGMEYMDQIIFLDEGKIAMSGTHEQLMAKNERYRHLYLLDRGL
ncbi:thiol reductant ABC exporter subunit CydC [Bacillus sp. FJAT-49732]|uniref:Thiol reductant ABC exporter subunit CydC n=1 Tax=Lederbergia citrisecunda TaxID=2833583 RepID=A0A942TM18_9BACI|nr:thiol reductant ABC exporter subunit CydC [Lederbergia citrisecunda]MBS4198389.1 thiol reductant ABC exporter subunit CydC [Lederbergia citrisecunda]